MEQNKLKSIRSFVRRSRQLRPKKQQTFAATWPKFGLPTDKVLNFTELFANSNPITIEIGFGSGENLSALASKHPEQNFIGIEVHQAGISSLLEKIIQNNLTNIRIIAADAIEIFDRCIPENSIDKILIYFPDPWPKQRHHKRRLIQPEFIKLLQNKIKINGILHIATDWEDYALYAEKVMAEFPNWRKLVDSPHERFPSKYEKRGIRLGHRIWDLMYGREIS